MKKFGLITAVFIFMLGSVIAQPSRGQFSPEDMAARQTDRMAEKIEFTKAQEEKVYELNLKYAKKFAKIRKEMRGSDGWQAMREKGGELNVEKEKELKEILTDKQWESYLEYKKEMDQRRKERGGQRGPR